MQSQGARRHVIRHALLAPFRQTVIHLAGQTARAATVGKFILLCRLIISTCLCRFLYSSIFSLSFPYSYCQQYFFSKLLNLLGANQAKSKSKALLPEGIFKEKSSLHPVNVQDISAHRISSASSSENHLPDTRQSSSNRQHHLASTSLDVRPAEHQSGDSLPSINAEKNNTAHNPSMNAKDAPDKVDYLGMRGWLVKKVEPKRHETLIHAVLITKLTQCQNKNCNSKNIKRNGFTKELFLWHTPSDERPRRIVYRLQCYYCRDCEETSLQPVTGKYQHTRMTRQLRRYIARQSLVELFAVIARRVGRSEKSIRKTFAEHQAHLESIRKVEAPRVMGLDGVYVKRKESLIVVDLERKRPVLMYPSIKERAVVSALLKMSGIDDVAEVVTDTSGSLRRVKKAATPKARHTDDRYHVQRMANAALDTVRKALTPGKRERKKGQMGMCKSHILRKRKKQLKADERADLEWCLGLYPLLRLTYDLKEAYCEMWSAPDIATARQRYTDWLELHKSWKKAMPEDLRGAFDKLIRVMWNWDEEIFNYFEGRHTNACTESANARVKENTRKAPRSKFSTIDTKVIQGWRLEQHREAVRQRGKKKRQPAGNTQQTQPSPPAATIQAVTQQSEVQTPLVTPSPAAADLRTQGPRLEVDRIKNFRLRREKNPNAPPSSQRSLFE